MIPSIKVQWHEWKTMWMISFVLFVGFFLQLDSNMDPVFIHCLDLNPGHLVQRHATYTTTVTPQRCKWSALQVSIFVHFSRPFHSSHLDLHISKHFLTFSRSLGYLPPPLPPPILNYVNFISSFICNSVIDLSPWESLCSG